MPTDAFARFRQLRGSPSQAPASSPSPETEEGQGVAVALTGDPIEALPLLVERPAQAPTGPAQAAAPLTPQYPCVVCGGTDRWDDAGIWRCTPCWPTSLTKTARRGAPR